MIKEITATGKDIVEATENAKAALGAGPLDDVKIEIVHAGSRGIFGIIGVKPAMVKASIVLPDAPERRERSKKEPKSEKQNRERTENPQRKEKPAQKPAAAQKKEKQQPRDKKPRENAAPKAEKPKSAVIPEKDLVMERKEVTPGQDVSFDFVCTLLSDIGLNAKAELYACSDGTRRINIVGEDASILIGHHGDTLDALQYLANLASAQKNEAGERDKTRVTVDIEGYRAKREETLRALARRMAAKALRNKRSVMLEPMSAYERRIIHSEVQSIEGVSTNSIGSDTNRKIVIYLTDKKPVGVFDEGDETDAVAEETSQIVEKTAAEENEAAADVCEAVSADEGETVSADEGEAVSADEGDAL